MESRLKKSLNTGGRQDRSNGEASHSAPEDKFISTQERRRMWSEEWTQSALPKLPNLSGWHLCWLSTTNSYDSIDKRIRLGYVPVKSEEYQALKIIVLSQVSTSVTYRATKCCFSNCPWTYSKKS